MFEKNLNRAIEIIGEILLVIMTLVTTFAVVTRYFFKWTPSWAEEGALLCMLWFGFLSMAIGVRDDRHISIDLLVRMLPMKVNFYFSLITKVLILIFGVFMVIEGSKMCLVATKNYLPGIKLNSAYLYAPVPLSGIAIIYYVLRSFKKAKRGE